jgi:Zn-dependent protease
MWGRIQDKNLFWERAVYYDTGRANTVLVLILLLMAFLRIIQGAMTPANLIVTIVGLLIAFSVHECAHAWAAYQMGDPTAKNMGRLTLDPRAHLDPVGAAMVLVAGFGWARPVPVNPYNLRGDRRTSMALVSASGPLSNLFLAVLFATPLRLGLLPPVSGTNLLPSPWELIANIAYLNIVLMVFNLLPIAPLDGFSVALALLPDHWARELEKLEPYGMMILFLLIVLGSIGHFDILWTIMGPPIRLLGRLVLGF